MESRSFFGLPSKIICIIPRSLRQLCRYAFNCSVLYVEAKANRLITSTAPLAWTDGLRTRRLWLERAHGWNCNSRLDTLHHSWVVSLDQIFMMELDWFEDSLE